MNERLKKDVINKRIDKPSKNLSNIEKKKKEKGKDLNKATSVFPHTYRRI